MRPTPEQIESVRRAAYDLLYRIREQGIEVDGEFMKVLEKLVDNPVREDLR
jgi:hypothetical protein